MKTVMSSFHFFLPKTDMNRKGMPASNKIFILAICLLTLIGCVMESQEPVGETPASINPQDWEGTWVSLDKSTDKLVLQVVNAPRGILLMKMGEWNEEKKQEQFSKDIGLYLRQTGNWIFASWKYSGDPGFIWGRIGNWAGEDGERVLVFWLPDENEVTRIIKQGELPGRLVGKKGQEGLILGPLLPQHYQVLRDNGHGIFFKDKPAVYVRTAKH